MFTPILRALRILNEAPENDVSLPINTHASTATPENGPTNIETPSDAANDGKKVGVGRKRDRHMNNIPRLHSLKRSMTISSPSASASHDLIPNFFIYRQDGTKVPLIPLDELPPGLRIGEQNWFHRFWLGYMIPASLSRYTKRGEYEVTIQAGAQLKPQTSSTVGGRTSAGREQGDPIVERYRCVGSRHCEEDGCGDYPCHLDRKTPLESPLLTPQDLKRSRSQVPLTPPNSLATPLSGAQSIKYKGGRADVHSPDQDIDTLGLQRGLDSLARQQSASSQGSESNSPYLLDLDSIKGTSSHTPATPVDPNDTGGENFDVLTLSNSVPPRLDTEEEPQASRRLTFP
ncbi:uncharacterized protein GIQ15_01747 [Arthroderma uncinatum]|uniref:uncharacterized protein n=1 Tax=Arthroderma uncinatum TaxID=74035 RepID=UPI00144AE810|nr:uncharacterized protein GIQ15_01747 [Arthroderma uncinatum]KAF3492230.1 hypothetical protein GIQ15_01747 [Arthroderma uncinatum]